MKEILEPNVLVESISQWNLSSPLQAVTKAKAVYVETRSRILKGMLAPGSAVNQEALAAELGVSITPLREALRHGASLGEVCDALRETWGEYQPGEI